MNKVVKMLEIVNISTFGNNVSFNVDMQQFDIMVETMFEIFLFQNKPFLNRILFFKPANRLPNTYKPIFILFCILL